MQARRILTFIALAIALFIVASQKSYAWGPEGHETVGAIADQLLSANAKQKIADIVGVDLRTSGPWLDCVKSVHRQTDGTFHYVVDPRYEPPCTPFANDRARMEDYAGRNWYDCFYASAGSTENQGCHNTYHFDDVAVQRDHFDRNFQGTNEHDLVAAINAAIAVLLDRPAPPPFSIKDKKEAVLMLAHLVGDQAQPLHVAALYLDTNGQFVDPDVTHTIDPATETIGGNALMDGHTALHTEWDHVPQDLLPGLATPELVAAARAVPATAGRIEDWSTAWATDTVLVAHQAFTGLTFANIGAGKWSVIFADQSAYNRSADTIKRQQLAKAGARLAAIVNTLWP